MDLEKKLQEAGMAVPLLSSQLAVLLPCLSDPRPQTVAFGESVDLTPGLQAGGAGRA